MTASTSLLIQACFFLENSQFVFPIVTEGQKKQGGEQSEKYREREGKEL